MGFFEAIKNLIKPDFILFSAVVVLAYLYFCWRTLAKSMEVENLNLKTALNQMEEQTRLIIKTDLELSQTQEENDRQLTSFRALQTIVQRISLVLEEDKVFDILSPDSISDLGFSFIYVFIVKDKNLIEKKIIGYSDSQKLNEFLEIMNGSHFVEHLREHPFMHSNSISSIPDYIKSFLEKQAMLKSYMISVLKSKGEILGGVILGNEKTNTQTEGVRELSEVFATQLAQSLDNIRMFEKLYHARQELEMRVKQRTVDLEHALKDLESANRRKTEFVSAVSHEFRTPLTSIKGYAALLAGGKFGDLPEKISTRLNRINNQADSLVGMINDLLDIARIESGRVQIALQQIDIAEMAKAEAEMFFPQLQEKGQSIEINVPETAIVNADKQLLQRVMINLMSNAIKFTPDGKKIHVSIIDEEKQYRISVKDEGIGIPASDLENVFKEFFRVDTQEHKNVKGTGLGLSLVANIVRAHKGQIWVESDIGKGANFVFILPKNVTLAAGAEIAI